MHLTESQKGLEMAACSGVASQGMGALPIVRRTPSEIEASDHGVKAHRMMAHRQGHYYREDLEEFLKRPDREPFPSAVGLDPAA